MKLRFEFHTARPVPLYGRLCNQFLRHPQVQAIGQDEGGYFLEAEGEQDTLSALADLIGRVFPLSCWLTDSGIQPIEQFRGNAVELKGAEPSLPYCQHCLDDPQSHCPHCGARPVGDDATAARLDQLLKTFTEQGEVQYRAGDNTLTLVRLDRLDSADDALLFCDPEALNHSLHINDIGIQQLGSIEKPRLLMMPRAEFRQRYALPRARYRVQQSADRGTLALAKRLAQSGIPAVGIRQSHPPLCLTQFGDTPVPLTLSQAPGAIATHEPPRHRASLLGLTAHWDDGRIRFRASDTLAEPDPDWAAACALEGVRQRDRAPKRSAVLYLSRRHRSGLLYKDNEGEYQWLVRLPDATEAPLSPNALLEAIGSAATGERLLTRYQQVDPDHLAALAALPQTPLSGSFHSVLALAAWFSGQSSATDPDVAGEAFLCQALRFGGQAAPRIDYGVKREAGTLVVQWQRALQACLSYRLADPDQKAGVAFGVIDSFCDFVCNWVEQLDMNIGLDEVILAGDEFDNPVLLERLRLRLGKNIALRLPTDFGPGPLVTGALFVPQALAG